MTLHLQLQCVNAKLSESPSPDAYLRTYFVSVSTQIAEYTLLIYTSYSVITLRYLKNYNYEHKNVFGCNMFRVSIHRNRIFPKSSADIIVCAKMQENGDNQVVTSTRFTFVCSLQLHTNFYSFMCIKAR